MRRAASRAHSSTWVPELRLFFVALLRCRLCSAAALPFAGSLLQILELLCCRFAARLSAQLLFKIRLHTYTINCMHIFSSFLYHSLCPLRSWSGRTPTPLWMCWVWWSRWAMIQYFDACIWKLKL